MERGLLDLSVQLSTRNITAGNEFALFVLATNPFDKPVWIREVNVSLPSELKLANERDVQEKVKKEHERQKDSAKVAEQRLTEVKAEISTAIEKMGELAKTQYSEERTGKIEYQLQSLQDKVIEIAKNEINISVRNSTELGTLKIGSNFANIAIGGGGDNEQVKIGRVEIYDSGIASGLALARTVKLKSSLPDGVALQPGSTVVLYGCIEC